MGHGLRRLRISTWRIVTNAEHHDKSQLAGREAREGRAQAVDFVGWRLVAKLSLTFVLINVATYFSFGLAHRLVRAELGKLPVEARSRQG